MVNTSFYKLHSLPRLRRPGIAKFPLHVADLWEGLQVDLAMFVEKTALPKQAWLSLLSR